MELIRKKQKEEFAALESKYEEKHLKLLLELPLGKKVEEAVKVLNENTDLDISIKHALHSTLFEITEINTLEVINKEREIEAAKLHDKYTELIALYGITSTYEQRISLLKEYGIIKGNA